MGLPSFRILKYTFDRILTTDNRQLSYSNRRTFFTEKHLCPIANSRTECRIFTKAYFFHRINSVTNRKHFRIQACVKRARFVLLEILKYFQFQQNTIALKELLQLDGTKPHCKGNTVYFCSVVEIFPPHKCTHGPGEDPFEAVMCAVGAASQISCCL